MRFVISVLLMSAIVLNLPAQNTNQIKQPIGYSIKASIKPFKSGYLFLAYHFGTKQFLIDSSKINSEGQAIFTGQTKLLGGIYMIVFPEKNGWIECLLDQQQHFSVTADTSNIVKSIAFTGTSDNVVFN